MQTLPRETADRQNPRVQSLSTLPINPVTQRPAQGGPSRFRALVQTIFRIFGIDRAIAYTLIGRGWSVITGPVSLLLIARFLRPEEQGFYYGFSSVIALNMFFELGLSYVLLQFASHEKAHLEWNSLGTLDGSQVARARLGALLRTALKWYGVAAVVGLIVVLPVGLIFFARPTASAGLIAWRVPWIWLALAAALNLFVTPMLAIVEGCGMVSQMASMRVRQNVLTTLGLCLTLLCHGALYAGPVSQTLNVAFAIVWLFSRFRSFFEGLLRTDPGRSSFPWRAEVWPFQWRIAVSWISGYIIFQLFTPVLFVSHGPVVAGQMGMSLSLCNGVSGVAMAWMTTKAAPFGVLVAKREWAKLDTQFFRTLRQSFLLLVAGSLAVYLGVAMLSSWNHPYSKRLLAPLPFALLLVCTILNYAVYSEALYLRAHKAEPFLWLSVLGALLTGGSLYFLAKPFGALGVSAGYLASCSVGTLIATTIFYHRRSAWHKADAPAA